MYYFIDCGLGLVYYVYGIIFRMIVLIDGLIDFIKFEKNIFWILIIYGGGEEKDMLIYVLFLICVYNELYFMYSDYVFGKCSILEIFCLCEEFYSKKFDGGLWDEKIVFYDFLDEMDLCEGLKIEGLEWFGDFKF